MNDKLFSAWQNGICPGGQVIAKHKGQIVYEKYFGYADLEFEIPVTADTLFHVASVSKQITVMCVLLLQEDGKLNIDDDVRKFLPDIIRFSEPVTIRNLMNNVSGIRDQWELLMIRGTRIDDTITQEDALGVIAKQTSLNFEPGSRYLYSNSNFTLLAEIVSRISGKTLNEFASERIFIPLGMKNTVFKDEYWKVIKNRARSYLSSGHGEFHENVLNYGAHGATSLNTTARDFLLWLDNFKNPVICKPETIEIMKQCPTLADGSVSSYACGLGFFENKGHKAFGHSGADAEYRADTAVYYEDDLEIAVFTNTSILNPSELTRKIANIVLNIEEETVPDADCSAYVKDAVNIETAAGLYVHKDSAERIIKIYEKNGELYQSRGYEGVKLVHSEGNRFTNGIFGDAFYFGFGDETLTVINKSHVSSYKKFSPKIQAGQNFDIYEGKYVSEEADTDFVVKIINECLCLCHYRYGESFLIKTGANKFTIFGEIRGNITFTKGSGGKVIGCTISSGRVLDLPFSRV